MKFLFSSLILFFSTFLVNAQELHLNWTRFIGGDTVCFTHINHLVKTKDNGIVFVGRSSCDGNGDLPSKPAPGNKSNVMIGKLDSNLQIIWVRLYGGSLDDEAICVTQMKNGGFAILANTFSTDGDVTGYQASRDFWLIYTDSLGNMTWEKAFGGPASDQALSIAATDDGGIIMLGTSNGSGGDVPFHYGTSQFLMDWVVIKVDGAGNKQWAKTIGGSEDENTGSIIALGQHYYLAGRTNSHDHDCYDSSWHVGVATSDDAHLICLDTGGTVLWDHSYGGSGGDGCLNAMLDSRDSTFMLLCATTSIDYMVTDKTTPLVDLWLLKADLSGNFVWARRLGKDTAAVASNSAVLDTFRNRGYVAYTDVAISAPVSEGIGSSDMIVFVTDSSGHKLKHKVFGGNMAEFDGGIASFHNGIIATGSSVSIQFTEGSNSGRQNNVGDAFLSYIDFFPLDVHVVNSKMDDLQIYPNPATDKCYIKNQAKTQLHIHDVLGRLMYTSLTNAEQSIDVHAWPRGLYYVQRRDADNITNTQTLLLQ